MVLQILLLSMAENAALYPLYDVTDGGDDHELPGFLGRALAHVKSEQLIDRKAAVEL